MKTEFIQAKLADTYRASSAKIIASLVLKCGDLTLAEDALHDACINAQKAWKKAIPTSPASWLYVIAKRRMIDRLRKVGREYPSIDANDIPAKDNECHSLESNEAIPDERLALMFICCHPALKSEAQVALILKTLSGLTVREIARAFLVSESAMERRLSRAKLKIKANQIPFEVPSQADTGARVEAVLAAIYLIFNESYSAFEGQTLTRKDLANEAIRLARLMYTLMPGAEVAGLLALLLLHQSRDKARCEPEGRFIPLEFQDRRRWDSAMIAEGIDMVELAMRSKPLGAYQLQAAISAVHSQSESWLATDWGQIIGLYRELLKFKGDAITELNLYCAVAYSGASKLAYGGLLKLAGELGDYQPYCVARAFVTAQLGMIDEGRRFYLKAISLSKNGVEKRHLKKKLAELG